MVEKLGYDPAGVRERMLQLYEKHGTTALGLCKEDGKSLDWNDWHKDVHWGSLDSELLKKKQPPSRRSMPSSSFVASPSRKSRPFKEEGLQPLDAPAQRVGPELVRLRQPP